MAVKNKTSVTHKENNSWDFIHVSEKQNFPLTVDLCNTSTTLHSDSDVNSSKAFLSQQQYWLQELQEHAESNTSSHIKADLKQPASSSQAGTHLVLEGGWLQHLQRFAINLQKAIPPLAVGNCCGGFLATSLT